MQQIRLYPNCNTAIDWNCLMFLHFGISWRCRISNVISMTIIRLATTVVDLKQYCFAIPTTNCSDGFWSSAKCIRQHILPDTTSFDTDATRKFWNYQLRSWISHLSPWQRIVFAPDSRWLGSLVGTITAVDAGAATTVVTVWANLKNRINARCRATKCFAFKYDVPTLLLLPAVTLEETFSIHILT